jgi:hypothetical protein
MIKKMIACGACIVLLPACYAINTSQAPLTTTYPLTEQQKMQAAHHWDVLAEHEAKLISQAASTYSTALFVDGGGDATDFDKSFKNLLTSQLVKNGSIVKTSPSNASVVTYDVDVVEHKDQDLKRAPVGSWTLLTGGVAVVAHAARKWSEPVKLLIPAAIGADAFSGNWVRQTNFEIVVTTRITTRDQITHSSSNIYYINGGDFDHYAQTSTSTTIKVTGE